MLTNLIENRGKEFASLIKIGDHLGRSLRTNVELFFVDQGRVTYVTEGSKLINAKFETKPTLKLTDIVVDDTSVLENEDSFNKVTESKVRNILFNLFENDYSTAETSFDSLLSVFETRLSYDRIKARLRDKSERFGEQTKIVGSPEFQKLESIKPQFVEMLKENKNILNIPEINNALKLATVIAKAFNQPRITYEDLTKNKKFVVESADRGSIYEHLCKQELIAKELLEAKQNFDSTWATNDMINDLASMVYEKNTALVEEKVAELITNIPYFALATKTQLNKLISNSLSLSETEVSNQDISKFASKIFGIKKPVKEYIMNLLNTKYGINVLNLTETPTFGNLLKTETVIITALGKLSPKNSALKDTLLNLAESLKIKNGVESIDLATFLYNVFDEAGYGKSVNETSLLQYLDFNQVADDLGKIGSILKMMRPMLGGQGGMPGAGGAPQTGGMPSMDGVQPGIQAGDMAQGAPVPPEAAKPGQDLTGALDAAAGMDDEGGVNDGEGELDPAGEEDPQAVADGVTAEDEMGMEGGEDMDPMTGEEVDEPIDDMEQNDLTALVADIEDLLGNIKAEMGLEDEMGAGEFEGEPAPDEEGMEGIPGEEPDGDEGIPEEGGEDFEEPPSDEGGEEPEEEPAKPSKPPFKKR